MTLDRRTSQTESACLTRFAVERYPSAKRACAEVEHWDDLRTERYVEGRTVIGTTLFGALGEPECRPAGMSSAPMAPMSSYRHARRDRVREMVVASRRVTQALGSVHWGRVENEKSRRRYEGDGRATFSELYFCAHHTARMASAWRLISTPLGFSQSSTSARLTGFRHPSPSGAALTT